MYNMVPVPGIYPCILYSKLRLKPSGCFNSTVFLPLPFIKYQENLHTKVGAIALGESWQVLVTGKVQETPLREPNILEQMFPSVPHLCVCVCVCVCVYFRKFFLHTIFQKVFGGTEQFKDQSQRLSSCW
jgi:hypothetical protein